MITENGPRCAALAVLLLAGPVGSAQQASSAPDEASEGVSAEQGAPEGEPEVIVMRPEDRQASMLAGTPVFEVEGAEIGEVDDLVLSEDGTVEVVLALGGIAGLGEKLVLVPWDRLDVSMGEDVEGRPRSSIGLRDGTGKQLADSLPRFRYEPE